MSRPADLGGAFVVLYEQLRAVARAKLGGGFAGAGSPGGAAGRGGGGGGGISLQATAVVHEALLRLSGKKLEDFVDEQHILAAASTAIRHVIVDHMRQKLAIKRNQGQTRSLATFSTDEAVQWDLCDDSQADLALDLDAALSSLADVDPEMRVIVELHTYGGIPLVEVAALLGSSERTVRRRWQFAAALLRQKLADWKQNDREPLSESTPETA